MANRTFEASTIEEVRENVLRNPKPLMDLEYLLALDQKLKASSDEASSKLKQNVYENYSLFIESSKEISYLKDEMRTLENLLEQQQDFLGKLFNKLNDDINAQQEYDAPKPGRSSFEMLNSEISDEMLEEIEPSWLKKVPEELDIIIAQHEFEEGVKLAKSVRQHLKEYPTVKADLRYKIDVKLEELVDSIRAELQISSKSAASMRLLRDLNLSSNAVKIYLNKQSLFLQNNVKLMSKLGPIPVTETFIKDLTDIRAEFIHSLELKDNLESPQYAVLIYWLMLEIDQYRQTLKSADFETKLLKEAQQLFERLAEELLKEARHGAVIQVQQR